METIRINQNTSRLRRFLGTNGLHRKARLRRLDLLWAQRTGKIKWLRWSSFRKHQISSGLRVDALTNEKKWYTVRNSWCKRKHDDEKSKMRKHPERRRKLESLYVEPFENYLRVAPIRSGDSVTVRWEVLRRSWENSVLWNKQGGTASDEDYPSHAVQDLDCMGFFYRIGNFVSHTIKA